MTHIKNVSHILQQGITHRNSPNANPEFTAIGDPSLIVTRDRFKLYNGRLLGEYVPFYFGTLTPMLYVVQNGFNGLKATPAQEIVYCVTSVQQILNIDLPFVFTNGHVVDSLSAQFSNAEVAALPELIDWEAVQAKFWKKDTDLDFKRRKQAEFLILGDVPLKAILGFIVYNQNAKNRLLETGVPDSQLLIGENYYFSL